jgi:hypothetical protein
MSTAKPIFVGTQEEPPAKVMQTAAIGQSGFLQYRLDLEDSIQNGWAFAYFAEIDDLTPNDTRSFKWEMLGSPVYYGATVNPSKNAHAKFRAYELEFKSVSFPRHLYLGLLKTNGSSKGPMINALEIYNCTRISTGSQDGKYLSLKSTLQND